MFEQRQDGRYDFSGDKVQYTLNPFSEDEVFEADIINFNETGICLLSANLFSVGQEITIKNFMSSSRTAVVIWVEQNDDRSFKVGLSFT